MPMTVKSVSVSSVNGRRGVSALASAASAQFYHCVWGEAAGQIRLLREKGGSCLWRTMPCGRWLPWLGSGERKATAKVAMEGISQGRQGRQVKLGKLKCIGELAV
ncbi:hypothetical protein E2562_001323 [Oryza meyeriana var. granulata]|uniref:Uncharacterized protein n=1 Tax=Oryza meyeriana var. granulata TaxID=110450 RepID=A0A6G1DC96_9ORYZ|nr:hypothetical protein E2562_001323 [Oryza meyeriana var. granulata]